MLTDNHNLKKNVATNEKYVLSNMCSYFCKIALYIYFVIRFEPFWS